MNEKLPTLPIPRLEETKDRLLEWVKPLVDDEQFQKTVETVEAFFQPNGEAERVQKQLIKWDEKTPGSWLKPFWDDLYLTFRGSLPFEMNFAMLLEATCTKNYVASEDIAARISYLVAEFYATIANGTLETDQIKGTPLCMSQYPNIFRSARIPQHKKDGYIVQPLSTKNNHMLIGYRNHFYKITVSDETGQLISEAKIRRAIQSILEADPKLGENIGVFTACDRENATKVYEKLQELGDNKQNFNAIHEALALLIIDEETNASTLEDLFSNATSKFFDKTLQISIAENGEIGFNFEHFGVDGATAIYAIHYIQNGLNNGKQTPSNEQESAPIQKLNWTLSDKLQETLQELAKVHEEKRVQYIMHTIQFADFGTDKIKTLGISPDAFFHIALQVAQYRTFGQFKSTYEPVSLRIFEEGRTESARAVSTEKIQFAMALEKGNDSDATLYALMQEASNAHSARIRDAQRGHGIERHLFGLQKMAEQNDTENKLSIFKDPSFQALKYDFLSTSGLVLPNLKAWTFGPVVENGYGISYSIFNNFISATFTAKRPNDENAQKLIAHLEKALHEMKEIAENNL